MKKGAKIALWIVGSLVVLVVGAFLCADIIASRLVQKEVQKAFAQMPDADAKVGGIYLNLISGSAIVKDITFCTNSLAWEDTIPGQREPGLAIHIPTLSVWNIHYWDLLREHRVVVHRISLDDPTLLVYIDEKNPESILPKFPKDTTLDKAEIWLKSVEIRHFDLEDFSARIHSTRSPLKVALDSLTTEVNDISYDLTDSLFAYNDSVYLLSIKGLKAELPDGASEVEVHDLKTKDQGPLTLGYTRYHNIVSLKHLADVRREPTTWIDIEVNAVNTSAFNPIRKILAQDWTLESIDADVRRLYVRRDTRYPPKEPYSNPQDFLRKLPVQFKLKQVTALARKIDIDMQTTDINCGEMHIKNARGKMTNVTNRTGATWYNYGKAPFGANGIVEAKYDIHMNKSVTFDISIKGSDIETSELNSFIRPLVGITSECHIDKLDAAYSGDRNMATGTFCMQYHGLNVKVHKEDKIPYEIVTKNADFFTSAANSLVPKSNPSTVDPAPRAYEVEWKQDVWKPYPLFLFGPCIDGIKKTMLPGLYVHKQTKK